MKKLWHVLKEEYPLLIPLVGVVIAFAQVLTFDFVSWDDPLHVTENPLLLGEGTWKDHILTPAFGYPIPLTILSYQVEVMLGGMRPGLMHATNLVLHVINVTLLFGILRKLKTSSVLAALAVVPLALHPSVSEPVAWITGRKDLLALAFVLGAFLIQLYRRDWVGHSLTLILGVCAVLCKPVAVFLAPVALLASWRIHNESIKLVLQRGFTWLAALLPIVVLAYLGQDKAGALTNDGNVSTIERVVFAFGFHTKLLFMAQEPSAKYLPAWPPELGFWQAISALVLVLALTALYFFRDRPILVVGLAWMGFAYLPSANIVPLTRVAADSYLYPSLAGAAFLVAALADTGLKPSLKWALLTVGTALATLLTFPAVAKWENSESLWTQAYSQYSDVRLCNNIAVAQFDAKEVKKGLRTLGSCLKTHGPNFKVQKNMALGFYLDGNPSRSLKAFEHLHKSHPDDPVVKQWLHRLRVELHEH